MVLGKPFCLETPTLAPEMASGVGEAEEAWREGGRLCPVQAEPRGPSSLCSWGRALCGGQGPAGFQCPCCVMAATGGAQGLMAGGRAPSPQTVGAPSVEPDRIWEEVWFGIHLLRNTGHVQSCLQTRSPRCPLASGPSQRSSLGDPCPACLPFLQHSVLSFPAFRTTERRGLAGGRDRRGRNRRPQ